MKTLLYYMKALAAWLWFGFVFLIGNILMLFRWKDPTLSKFMGQMLYAGVKHILGFRAVIHGKETLYNEQPCIYVCNHQSNLDILIMSDLYPYRTMLIGKKEIKWFPIFGTFFYGSGNILLDRQNRTSSVATLGVVAKEINQRRINLWVFPEGTRNRGAEKMLPFKKGAFRMAIDAQVPIIPLVSQHVSKYFNPAEKKLCGNALPIHMAVLEAVHTKGLTPADTDKLMQTVREKMEQGLERINAHANSL